MLHAVWNFSYFFAADNVVTSFVMFLLNSVITFSVRKISSLFELGPICKQTRQLWS